MLKTVFCKRTLALMLAVALCVTAVLAPLPVHAASETAETQQELDKAAARLIANIEVQYGVNAEHPVCAGAKFTDIPSVDNWAHFGIDDCIA